MGDKVKPAFKSDFPLIPEGIYVLRTDKANVEKSEQAVKVFKVESIVEGSDDDGARAFDNFPLVAKGNFGLARLAGFMIKLGVMKEKDEIDADVFSSEDFESKFKMSIPGKVFGGRIKHKKTDQGNIMANIVEYYTAKEAQEAMKGEKEKPSKGKKEEKEKETEKKNDDWV